MGDRTSQHRWIQLCKRTPLYGAKLPVGKVWYQERILSGNKWTLPAPETTERAKVDDDVTACYCLPHHKTWSRDSSVSFIHRNVFHFTIYLFCSSSKKLRCDESSQMTCAQSYKVPKFSRVCVCDVGYRSSLSNTTGFLAKIWIYIYLIKKMFDGLYVLIYPNFICVS